MLIVVISALMGIDAFAVGIAYGSRGIRLPVRSLLTIVLCSVIGGYIAVFLGDSIAHIFPPDLAYALGNIALLAVGVWFLLQNIMPHSDIPESRTVASLAFRSLGITVTIVRNPVKTDLDKSGSIDFTEALAVGIALTADVLGAGLGLGVAGAAGFCFPPLVGVFEIIFIKTGIAVGKKIKTLSSKFKILSGLLPGFIMIALAVFKIFA